MSAAKKRPAGLGRFDPLSARRADREAALTPIFGGKASDQATEEEQVNTATAEAAEFVDESVAAATETAAAGVEQRAAPMVKPAAPAVARQRRTAKPRPRKVEAPEGLAMPAAKREKVPRTTVNTRVRSDIESRLQEFVSDYSATVQDVVDMALGEFLERRGYGVDGDQT